jgi:hypothetical protein
LKTFMDSYASGRVNGESVREWAVRIGKDGLKGIVKHITDRQAKDDPKVFVDWGDTRIFETPEAALAECAAPFAIDNLMRDLADDALIAFDRTLLANRADTGASFAEEGVYYALRRLLGRAGIAATDASFADVVAQVRGLYAGDDEVMAAVNGALDGLKGVAADKDRGEFREKLAVLIDLAAELATKPYQAPEFNAAALGDSSGSVLEMLRSQGAAE